MIVLKGHLVVEEQISNAIETFVFHSKYLENARLSFAQKLAIARSISLGESDNSMWDLIGKLNTLRNNLAHSLDDVRREKAMESVRTAYIAECGDRFQETQKDDKLLLSGVIALCLGFLGMFRVETEPFRDFIAAADRVANPDRHSK